MTESCIIYKAIGRLRFVHCDRFLAEFWKRYSRRWLKFESHPCFYSLPYSILDSRKSEQWGCDFKEKNCLRQLHQAIRTICELLSVLSTVSAGRWLERLDFSLNSTKIKAITNSHSFWIRCILHVAARMPPPEDLSLSYVFSKYVLCLFWSWIK